jgi:hypothetical protein
MQALSVSPLHPCLAMASFRHLEAHSERPLPLEGSGVGSGLGVVVSGLGDGSALGLALGLALWLALGWGVGVSGVGEGLALQRSAFWARTALTSAAPQPITQGVAAEVNSGVQMQALSVSPLHPCLAMASFRHVVAHSERPLPLEGWGAGVLGSGVVEGAGVVEGSGLGEGWGLSHRAALAARAALMSAPPHGIIHPVTALT